MKKLNNLNLKRFGIFFCFLLVGIVACDDDLLEQSNPNAVPLPDFWQSGADAEKGIIGAYSPLTNVQYRGRIYIFNTDYRDDIVNGYAVSPRTAPGKFQGDSSVDIPNVVWKQAWSALARANAVLFNVPNIDPDIDMDADKKEVILAEALYIRAFVYYDLVNLFRNVPLILAPQTSEEAKTVAQNTPEEVFTQIASDLESARQVLPRTLSENNIGRATWGAASALLAQTYLATQQFAQAETVLKEMVDSGLYSLVENYGDNFRASTENNSESVFEWQMIDDGSSGWAGDNAATGRANSIVPDIAPQGFTNQNGMRINQWAVDLFLDERTVDGEIDPRAFNTLFWETDETTTHAGEVLAATTYNGLNYVQARPLDTLIVYGAKYVRGDAEDGNTEASFHRSNVNIRVVRYSDVLLMYAEAIMQAGAAPANQAAVDAVNLVRERADMAPFDLSMTWQDVMDERVKELALEQTRYFDLLRWGMVKERIVDQPGIKSESGGVGAYQPGREYLDIPINALNLNPNLSNNPGY